MFAVYPDIDLSLQVYSPASGAAGRRTILSCSIINLHISLSHDIYSLRQKFDAMES